MTVQRPSAVARAVATLAVGIAVGVGAVALLRDPTAQPRPPSETAPVTSTPTAAPIGPEELAAAHAYLDAVEPLARDAGRTVQEGMKPAVTTLQDPDGDHAALVPRTVRWLSAWAATQAAWSQATPSPALRDAHLLFMEALATYAEVADHLARAATDDARRDGLVDEAIRLGTEADELYDRAAQIVQAHLVAGGEDPAVWLPLPTEP